MPKKVWLLAVLASACFVMFPATSFSAERGAKKLRCSADDTYKMYVKMLKKYVRANKDGWKGRVTSRVLSRSGARVLNPSELSFGADVGPFPVGIDTLPAKIGDACSIQVQISGQAQRQTDTGSQSLQILIYEGPIEGSLR